MNKKYLRLGALILSFLMLFSLAACSKKKDQAEETADPTEGFKSADEFGITMYGLIHESAFPRHDELEDWFEASQARDSLAYAVFYAREEASGLWYCWIYAAGYTFADAAELLVNDKNGTLVQINITLANSEATTPGAFCFSLPSEVEPSFSMTVNGETEGLIVTLSNTPAIPLIS